ncbi:3-hydroxyacyl-ACP dehydratase FabZ [bacterium]|jgi:3-hydroxyacyl-[acyl-carrier-protein] dehydratase|nr:3-hydroxyacyl-ACP dehydratase FabZ [bacterium]MBT3795196.1 3-hydroxyacyl-ACP dehydratase FabZ [bacterium]MBT4634487.1 3-hydroxyacyl-ACP dehydratase FabZ [bacterium]
MILDKDQIKKYIPHREPFLFVDEVVELIPEESITANVTFHEDSFFFEGHFPDNPVVPGVIIVEAMAQAGGVLIYKSFESKLLGLTPALVGINNVKFKAPTFPGDKLRIETILVKSKLNIFKLSAKAFNNDKLVVQADITATIMSN